VSAPRSCLTPLRNLDTPCCPESNRPRKVAYATGVVVKRPLFMKVIDITSTTLVPSCLSNNQNQALAHEMWHAQKHQLQQCQLQQHLYTSSDLNFRLRCKQGRSPGVLLVDDPAARCTSFRLQPSSVLAPTLPSVIIITIITIHVDTVAAIITGMITCVTVQIRHQPSSYVHHHSHQPVGRHARPSALDTILEWRP
jgi:hypothetical protein